MFDIYVNESTKQGARMVFFCEDTNKYYLLMINKDGNKGIRELDKTELSDALQGKISIL